MVKIEATLTPQTLQTVVEALQDLGCTGLTVFEARTDSRSGRGSLTYRGSFQLLLSPAMRLEVVLPKRRLEEALEIIARAAREPLAPDGGILVSPVSGAVRIRTGEVGEDALSG